MAGRQGLKAMAHERKSVRERARRKRSDKLTLPFRAVLALAFVWIRVLVGFAGDAFSSGLVFDPAGAHPKVWVEVHALRTILTWNLAIVRALLASGFIRIWRLVGWACLACPLFPVRRIWRSQILEEIELVNGGDKE